MTLHAPCCAAAVLIVACPWPWPCVAIAGAVHRSPPAATIAVSILTAAAHSNRSPPPLTAAPKSTSHHTGAQRLYSTVIEPAVDTNPAQHHLSSFASQFVGIAFMGRRRRGAYDF